MTTVGTIFYIDEDYAEKAKFCNENNLIIVEIEPDENGRRFQIQKPPQPTHDENLENLRYQRSFECFSVINRGQLWHETLTEEQRTELRKWYHDWLDVTKTEIIPTRPKWLK